MAARRPVTVETMFAAGSLSMPDRGLPAARSPRSAWATGVRDPSTGYQSGISPLDRYRRSFQTAAMDPPGIALLGPLSVNGDAVALSPRDRVVLAALAIRRGEVVSAERLADALWGEHPPASWHKVVPGCILRLRRALGVAAIETTPFGYRLAGLGPQRAPSIDPANSRRNTAWGPRRSRRAVA